MSTPDPDDTPLDPFAEPGDEEPRTIGPWGSLAIVMGSMLGIGIFLTPRIVAEAIQSPPLFLLAWALGGLIALAGAVAYAELGSAFPRAGGDYVFLREAFGEATAFASGWLLFAGIFVGSIATIAVPVFQFQVPVLLEPFLDLDLREPLLGPVSGAQLGGLLLVALLTAINIAGTRMATGLQLLLTLIPTAVLLAGALWAFGTAPHDTAVAAVRDQPFAGSPLAAFLTATLAIYFAYSGWNAVGYVGGEVRRPDRNIPLGLLGGTLLITAFYLVLCAAFILVLGIGGLTTAFEAGTATARALGGAPFAWTMNLLIGLALVGSLNGTILAGARIARAMARDRVLPTAVGDLHPRTRTPARALALQGSLAGLLILSGTFETLLELTGIAMFVMGGLTVCALFVLRRQRPQLRRPYRATGFPWLPGLYLLVSIAILAASLWRVVSPEDGTETAERFLPIIGLVIFAAALLTYHVRGRRTNGPTP
ncbi:MAG: amino acid permease [Deltaproteobacteria bacterium]|nr:MAG: amino acid permease [Deltaproteobacteria bacterium]